MERIVERLDGPCELDGNFELHGLVAGHLTLKPGAHIFHHGVIAGDLRISDGASADVRGLITGSVYACGSLHLTGTIRGALVTGRTAQVEIGDGAVIRRGRRPLVEVDF